MMFTATDSGEIRIFKIQFDKNSIKVEGSMKIEAEIKNLEVFHNNERLLIVNAIKAGKHLVYILNTRTKKVMNIIQQSNNFKSIQSILTFSIIKKPPEIFITVFTDDSINFCDIDQRVLNQEVKNKKKKRIDLKESCLERTKLVKILNHEKGCLNLLALSKQGILLLSFKTE